ncbi:GTP-binding protein Rho1 [Ceratobasidium sp. 370]|nr:GTP-binding protein Rho1 [Ceratobasidium sp. 370]
MPADIYALGMTIYETVTGTVPYADKADMAVPVEVLIHRRFPSRNDDLILVQGDKDQLWELMVECWNHKSSSRPQAGKIEVQLSTFAKRTSSDVLRRKLVIVGDPCGKSSLLHAYSGGIFQEVYYVPTVFTDCVENVEVYDKLVELKLYDTSGWGDYDRVRPLAYPDSDVFLVCFSVDNPDSLENVEEKWIPEVMHFCPGVTYILVGCKKDLRRDPKTIEYLRKSGQRPVTPEQGMEVAQRIGARYYLECSAKSQEGVREVFQYAARETLRSRDPKKGSKRESKDKCIMA